ncbi:hydrogenase expression/formation protein (plasmid) [Azospirillum oryzae]|uniref:Hydrogenase expression/formation protein n=1 Tax=Azospirillum oryzae TaxID=286727 RepID=A0A6N1AD25_9PROT|nr:hydrogenase expression/formation protein [Azospirillum oryzae]KAA0585833.1 hydrogenase expression/formation protein [Azospirillum oryzae]QKS49423.1 hydrogenase expression/formation protein [Azospirillum oryzae]GLR80677.1 hydrogenase expression/formation protein [Azospirillum oryzae]
MNSMFGMTHPPVGFGPGSQPDATEEGLEYLPMPSGMRVYEPHLPEVADPARAAAARAVLTRIHEGLVNWTAGEEIRIPVDDLDAPVLALVDEALGEGEVAVMVQRAGDRLEIQEASLAGVWRVRGFGDGAVRESLLIGAFPRVALNRAFTAVAPVVNGPAPAGLMNGQPILTELLDRSAAWRRGDAPHAVNFSLLPHTPEDLAFVEQRLGVGATTILSRGYGNCRVTATATPNVWWVRYYNSVDTLILDTVEIVDVPAVVCAAAEDIADSAERLAEILDALATDLERAR